MSITAFFEEREACENKSSLRMRKKFNVASHLMLPNDSLVATAKTRVCYFRLKELLCGMRSEMEGRRDLCDGNN